MFASVMAAASTISTLAGTGLFEAYAAGKANDDIAINVNLSVVSRDTLGLDLYAKLDENVTDPILIYENKDSGEDEVPVSLTYDENTESYKAYIPISAEKMADTYVCRIESDGKVLQDNIQYCLAEYAMTIEESTPSLTGNFIYSMLNYGAAAQKYFGYRTDNPANEELVAEDALNLNEEGIVSKRYVDEKKLKENGLVYETSTLLIDEELAMREYFTLAGESYTLPEDVTVNGTPAEFGSKKLDDKTYYYIDIENVSMENFDEKYAIKIGGETVAEYTVNDYLLRAYSEKKNDDLVELASRLYKFSNDLKEYRENNSAEDVYYLVGFEAGANVPEESMEDLYIPDAQIYKAGRKIYTLPTPYLKNSTFLGWYYDKELTRMADRDDVVDCNMVLYASMSGENVDILDNAGGGYISSTDVDNETFSLEVYAESEEAIRKNLTIMIAGDSDDEIEYDIVETGENTYAVVPTEGWEENEVYLANLPFGYEEVQFIHMGDIQDKSVDTYTIVTKHRNKFGIELNKHMAFISKDEISDLTGGAFSDLAEDIEGSENALLSSQQENEEVDRQQVIVQDFEDGTFCYDSPHQFPNDQIVAIYEGESPENLQGSSYDDSGVAYVKITDYDDNSRTYSYTAASFEEIINIPTMYPISKKDDKVLGDGNKLTVSNEALEYDEDINEMFRINPMYAPSSGDWVVLCDIDKIFSQAEKGPVNLTDVEYGVITEIGYRDSETIISYEPASLDEYEENMKYQYSEVVDVEAPEEGVQAAEEELKRQAEESGFIDDTVDSLAAAIEASEEFSEAAESDSDEEIELNFGLLDETVKIGDEKKSSWKFEQKHLKVTPSIKYGKNLSHFSDKNGIRATLDITFVGEFTNTENKNGKILVTANASFSQELMLEHNFKTNVQLKWPKIFGKEIKIIPIGIKTAQANMDFKFGTFTDFSAAATIRTVNDKEILDLTNMKKEDLKKFGENFVKELAKQSAEENQSSEDKKSDDSKSDDTKTEDSDAAPPADSDAAPPAGGTTEDSDAAPTADQNDKEKEKKKEETKGVIEDKVTDMNSLSERYKKMVKDSNGKGWVELCRVKVADIDIYSFYKIVNVHAPIYFTVEGCFYLAAGITFQFGYAKGWNICVDFLRHSANASAYDIEKANMKFDAYVMGTIGIKAGFTFCPRINVLSDKLLYAGFNLYAGLKYQIWGYFYYHLEWEAGKDLKQDYCGAIYMELAICADIRFTTQLLDSKKLIAVAPIWSDEFRVWDYGEEWSPYEFVPMDDEKLEFDMIKTRTMKLPNDIYDMNRLNMTSGELKMMNVMTEADAIKDSAKREKYLNEQFENAYTITFSNDAFSYNPLTNTVTVSGSSNSDEDVTMVITYRRSTTVSNRFKRVLKIHWEPYDSAAIYFVGENVHETCVRANAGDAVEWPADPTRLGYIFDGWFDENGDKFGFPATYPKLEKDIVYTAKWTPAPSKISAVNVYIQRLPLGSEYDPFEYELIDSTKPEKKKTYILAEDVQALRKYYDSNAYFNPNEDFSGCASLKNVTKDGNSKEIRTNDLVELADILPLINIPEGFSVNTAFSTDSVNIRPDGSDTFDIYIERNLYPLTIFDSSDEGKMFNVGMVYGTHLNEFIPDLTSKNCEFITWTTEFDDSNKYMGAKETSLQARLTYLSNKFTVVYDVPLYDEAIGGFKGWSGSEATYRLIFSAEDNDRIALSDILQKLSQYTLVQNSSGGYSIKDAVFVLPDGTCIPCEFSFDDVDSLDGENVVVHDNTILKVSGREEKLDYASYQLEYFFEDENGEFVNNMFDDEKEEYDRSSHPVCKYGEDVLASEMDIYSSDEMKEKLRGLGYEFDHIEFNGETVSGDVVCTADETHKNASIKVYYKMLPEIKITFVYPNESVTKQFTGEEIINTPSMEELKEIPAGTFEGWTWDEIKNSKGEVILAAQTEPTDDLSAVREAISTLLSNKVRKVRLNSVWAE